MIAKMKALLRGESENHLMPFFWQHGEDEAALRKYMEEIEAGGCRAVCVESRPHPDFCGPKWWADMDVILDEARRRGMKVWILDDSHFPTGFANGAVRAAPPELHRQSVCASHADYEDPAAEILLDVWGMIPPPFRPNNEMERYVMPGLVKDAPRFDDDQVLAVTAVRGADGMAVKLPLPEKGRPLRWRKPAGEWTIWAVGLSRSCGPHREYVNMLGTDQDLPFAATLPPLLEERLGGDWAGRLYLLWDNGADPAETARVRYAYMDAVTRLVRQSFSRQIGD